MDDIGAAALKVIEDRAASGQSRGSRGRKLSGDILGSLFGG